MGRWVIALWRPAWCWSRRPRGRRRTRSCSAPTVFASHDLPSDAITAFTVTCPPGYARRQRAASRGPGAGTTLLSVAPLGRARVHRSGSATRSRTTPTRVTVAVAAARCGVAGPVLVLKLVKTAGASSGRGQQKSGTLACPPHTTPAGAAVDLDPGRAKSVGSFAGAALSLRAHARRCARSRSGSRTPATRATMSSCNGSCVTVLLAPDVSAAQLSTTISTYANVIAPGPPPRRAPLPHRAGSRSARATRSRLGRRRVDGAAAIGASGSVVGAEHRRLAGHGPACQVICAASAPSARSSASSGSASGPAGPGTSSRASPEPYGVSAGSVSCTNESWPIFIP